MLSEAITATLPPVWTLTNCDAHVCLPPTPKPIPGSDVSSSPRTNDTFPCVFRLTISTTSSASMPPCVLADCHAAPV